MRKCVNPIMVWFFWSPVFCRNLGELHLCNCVSFQIAFERQANAKQNTPQVPSCERCTNKHKRRNTFCPFNAEGRPVSPFDCIQFGCLEVWIQSLKFVPITYKYSFFIWKIKINTSLLRRVQLLEMSCFTTARVLNLIAVGPSAGRGHGSKLPPEWL